MRAFWFLSSFLVFVLLFAPFSFANAAQPRVIGGQPADNNEWLATVALLNKQTVDLVESGTAVDVDGNMIPVEQANYSAQFCGGSLIASKWVLTAAHCMDSSDLSGNATSLTAADLLVLVGTTNLLQDGERMVVSNIFIHPDYNAETHDSDIALLELAGVTATAVQTISLFPGSPDAGLDATVVGWGARNYDNSDPINPISDDFPSQLHEVEIPVVSQLDCQDVYPGLITDNMLCAGFAEGSKDSCQGDSGGPLMAQKGGVFQQIGIVSFGEGCALPDAYGVYTRVDNYSGWISSLVSESFVNQPPVADFIAQCDFAGNACNVVGAFGGYDFFGESSQDPDGQIVNYHWDFGDGDTTTSTFSDASHRFLAPGEYVVTLTITDNIGLTSSTSQTFIIEALIPPRFESSTMEVASVSDLTIEVDTQTRGTMGNSDACDDVERCLATMYLDYGDGERELVQVIAGEEIFFPFIGDRATHVYAESGTYTLTLTTLLEFESTPSGQADHPEFLEDVITKEITVLESSNPALINETNLTATASEYLHYSIEVVPGVVNMNVLMSNVTGDPDLYVRFGSEPTLDDYDCRPYQAGGSDEVCNFSNPQTGTWHVMVHAYEDFSGMKLTAATSTESVDDSTLLSETNLTVTQRESLHYSFEVASVAVKLNVLMSNVSGDPDLYVRFGAKPTLDDYDCRPYQSGGSDEDCDFSNPKIGTWYVMVYAYEDFSAVNLAAVITVDNEN